MPNKKLKFLKYCFIRIIFIAFLSGVLSGRSEAQQVTSVYLYDDNGRLIAVIQPNGSAFIYEYDPAGNFTGISNVSDSKLRIIAFLPRRGPVGTRVTIYGTGFDAGVTGVAFNGATAQILQVNQTSIVAEVPLNATTGPITVFTNAGSVMSESPFTVRGVLILPRAITVSANDSVPFNANVSGLPTTNVIWSINGVTGGNNAFGTVTANGIYTAPNLVNSSPVQFTVRATAVDDSTLFDDATVTVIAAGEGYQFRSDGVSVRYGTPSDAVPVFVNNEVSVRYGTPPSTAPIYAQDGVSVKYGTLPNMPPVYAQDGVSVRYGTPPNTPQIYAQDGVSVGVGPFLSTLAPTIFTRGNSGTINITGILLNGATNISFYRVSNGSLETGITASNIIVNSEGTTMTSTLTVAGNVAIGNVLVVVTTPAGSTVRSPGIGNIIQVQ